jgi:hypothetical protein
MRPIGRFTFDRDAEVFLKYFSGRRIWEEDSEGRSRKF